MTFIAKPHAGHSLPADARGALKLTPGSVVLRNSFLTLLTEAWTLLALVVAMPKLVKYLGDSAFGLFSLAWVVIGYVAILDLGVSRAATKYVSEHLAQSDITSAEQIARSSLIINLVLGVLGGICLLVLSPWLTHHVFKTPAALSRQVNLILIAIAAAGPVLLTQAACRGILTSLQRFGWINSVNGIATGLQWALAYGLAAKGYGVGVVVLSTVVVRVFATVVYLWALIGFMPQILHGWGWYLHHLSKLVSYGGWVTISTVISPVLIYLDRIFVAYFVSLAAVTVYTIPFELMARLRVIPSSVIAALFPAFSERDVAEGQPGMQRLYSGAVRYLFLLLLPCLAYLIVEGPDVLTVWVGQDFSRQGAIVLQILAAGTLLNAIAYVPYAALQGLGCPHLTGIVHLIELPVHAVLCYVLVRNLGVPGAALASSVRCGLDAVVLFWAAQKYVGCRFSIQVLQRVLLPLCLLVVCLIVGEHLIDDPRLRLAVGMVPLLLYAAVVWKYSLGDGDRPIIARALNLFRPPAAPSSV
jgi:O-antigen/teichoic acid export membrane protein